LQISLIFLRLPRRRDVAFAQAIKTHRVVAEHFSFELIRQILARFEMRQVAAELVALMGGILGPNGKEEALNSSMLFRKRNTRGSLIEG
jgi:hypothetical protein